MSASPPLTFDDIIARKAADDHMAGGGGTATIYMPSTNPDAICYIQDLFCRKCASAPKYCDETDLVYMPCRVVHCVTPTSVAVVESGRHIKPEGATACPACTGNMDPVHRFGRWVDSCDRCRNGPGTLHRSATLARAGLRRAVSTRAGNIRRRATVLHFRKTDDDTKNDSKTLLANNNENTKRGLLHRGLAHFKRAFAREEKEEEGIYVGTKPSGLERKPTKSRNRVWQ